jgi:hypothetical protein
VSLVGVAKRREQYTSTVENDQMTAGVLLRIYRTFEETVIDPNMSGGFRECGFEFDTTAKSCRPLFTKEKLPSPPGFREICSFDFVLEKLWERDRNGRFEWMSKPEPT